MKFNIEIEIENGDYCNGCPCLNVTMGYCRFHKVFLTQDPKGFAKGGHAKRYRPEICKEQNKETK